MKLQNSLSLTFFVFFGIFCFWIGANFADRYNGNNLIYRELTPSTNTTLLTNTGSCGLRFVKFCEIDALLSKELAYDSGMNMTGMIEKSLHGYVEGIGEPYTEYFTPEENKVFLGDLHGDRKFEGIGAVVGKRSEGIIIQEIIKGSPAYQAGLKPQDIVVMIDNKPTKSMSVFDSIGYIRGTGGTEVKLTVMRISENRLFEVNVKRDKVNIPSVISQVYHSGDTRIGHITISILGEDTVASFARIANDLRYNQAIDALILDLRGNGGGILDSAVDIASHFVPRGQEVVSTTFKSFPSQRYLSKGYLTFEKIPLVILMDEMSASASEVLALALKHYRNATLVGEKSFGKGTIQTMTFLNDYSSLKYTIGKRFGPGNININHSGIVPDYPVAIDMTGFIYSGIDSQLEFAQQFLRSQLETGQQNTHASDMSIPVMPMTQDHVMTSGS